jgi:hypothetical protein
MGYYGHSTYELYSKHCFNRNNQRLQDITESRALLLEIGNYDPTFHQCLSIIKANILSQGISCKIDGVECTKAFKKHLEMHYTPFVEESIKSFLVFGFVPFRVRKLETGDSVPEILPAGSFDWQTDLVEEKSKRKRPLQCKSDENKILTYRVTPRVPRVKEEEISIYTYANPTHEVNQNFTLFATVVSPMALIVNDYRNLKNAQARRQHCDAWNCRSHLITKYQPQMKVQDAPDSAYLEFQDEVDLNPYVQNYKKYFPTMKTKSWLERSMMIERQLEASNTAHRPNVICLPREHDLVPQTNLTPVEDIEFLFTKYQQNLAALAGVPFEMVSGTQKGNENTRKTITTGRLFQSNMNAYCNHVQALLSQVYCQIYSARPERVEFTLTPMPRLEIESIEDFKVLYEIGALDPDSALQISKVLLGMGPKPKAKDGAKEAASKSQKDEPKDAEKVDRLEMV